MAQPKMGVVRWMLGRTFYPDNEYTRDNDGNPIRPYDMATDVMAEFMGVRVDPTDAKVSAHRSHASRAPSRRAGKVATGAKAVSHSADDSTIRGAPRTFSSQRASRCGASTRRAGLCTSAITS